MKVSWVLNCIVFVFVHDRVSFGDLIMAAFTPAVPDTIPPEPDTPAPPPPLQPKPLKQPEPTEPTPSALDALISSEYAYLQDLSTCLRYFASPLRKFFGFYLKLRS